MFNLRLLAATNKLKRTNLSDLIKASEYVQSLCLNVSSPNEILGKVWQHSLPLKDDKKHFLDPSNWDLSEKEIKNVQKINTDLRAYVDIIFDIYYSQKKKPIKVFLNKVTDLLPPWMVFPLYNASTIGWRMGAGEGYQDIYYEFIRSLSEEEFEAYSSFYPVPEYISVRFLIRRVKKRN